jgi:tetratricopeptide (TPR) repeat protein
MKRAGTNPGTDNARHGQARVNAVITEFFGALAIIVLFVKAPWRISPNDFARQLPSTAPTVAYVGASACYTCHSDISESFERSEMARSWSAPTEAHLSLVREETPPIEDRKLRLSYRAFERTGQLLQEEFRSEAGVRSHSLIRPVHAVVGSGNHGYSFVSEMNGYLSLLPLGWYRSASKWDLSPGFERHNARFDRKVPIECVACHNAMPQYIPNSRNRYHTPLPNGIDCERCHGPGELHVQLRSGSGPTPAPGAADFTIVNPARLPIDRRDDVCLQCHLISDSAVLAQGKEWTSYRPGERLSDSRRDLFLKPEDPAQFGFSSHATRLRLSRCWSDGPKRGTLTCITCHDSHKSQHDVPRSSYNAKCTQCHEPTDCRRPSFDANDSDADCVQCHMRQGSPANIAHTVFTDHWIRAKPQPHAPAGAMNPLDAMPGGRLQFIDFADGGPPVSATVRALAIAKYFDIRRAPDRRQALDALEEALEEDSENPELHFWLGTTRATMGRWKPALESFRKAAEKLSDPLTQNGLGEAQRETGRISESITTLTRCAEQYPDFLQTYREIAETYAQAGNLQAAIIALNRSLELYPSQPETAVRRAHLGFLAGEAIGSVMDRIDEAMQLSPDSPWLYWLQGQCLASEGKLELAIRAYELAIEIDPKFRPAYLAIGPALVEAGRFDEAQERLRQLRAFAPNDPILPAAQEQIDRMRRQPKK